MSKNTGSKKYASYLINVLSMTIGLVKHLFNFKWHHLIIWGTFTSEFYVCIQQLKTEQPNSTLSCCHLFLNVQLPFIYALYLLILILTLSVYLSSICLTGWFLSFLTSPIILSFTLTQSCVSPCNYQHFIISIL